MDIHRQELFKIRNNLFDSAAKGEISFDEDAYGIIRSTLNGSINFLNELSVFRFILFLAFSKRAKSIEAMDYLKRRQEALDKLPSYKRQIYEQAVKDMHFSILSFMVRSSLILGTLVRIVILFISINNLISFLFNNSQIRKRFEILDTEADALATA